MTTPAEPSETAKIPDEAKEGDNVNVNNNAKQQEKDNGNGNDLEKVEFVANDDEGKASIMKPRKPTRHHRATDSHYNKDGYLRGRKAGDDNNNNKNNDDNNNDDDDDNSRNSTGSEDTMTEFRNSKWYLLSASIFVFASVLYLAMACMIMDMYWFYKDVPMKVMYSDDDATWWNYFENCTDDGFYPEEVETADDDYTYMNWYNETAFFEDDIVWQPRIANANAPGYESYVSKYMLLYFSAALAFLVVGIIEVVLARQARFVYRVLYYIMMLAAAFGLVSAILTHKDPLWSNIANCISCNLWALEAIAIVYQRVTGTSEADEYGEYATILGFYVTSWFYVADFSFMVGTVGDAVTSYLYIFQIDNWIMGILAVVFATCWLICAIVYLMVAVHDHMQYKIYVYALLQEEKNAGLLGNNNDATGMVVGGGTGTGTGTDVAALDNPSTGSNGANLAKDSAEVETSRHTVS
mmetsp:Transcript_12648/g.26655  ORF Transcript_12648/g.26655 Transcript_12648/m.26655 type:complete len:466 (-) Transcript_12648:556-1953(-)|eukprot:CAMPEP_0168178572 /NCGR_PEP_ID=MMETSP0139_2-20121125/9234_1 /TAXON_ID=44445 /ORGANISM="Pseudo-nitzschia australis, Strain 10249 10 AB" /LENGTH=465 /DNA_ID=CAMNT_0008098049 /DNA_START=284 /DNA_END=1681 /DNA_ORIENTATION=+